MTTTTAENDERAVPGSRPRRGAGGRSRRSRSVPPWLAFVVAAMVLGIGLPLHGKGESDSKRDTVDRVLGCHAFAGGEGERRALEAAIERVVQEFNILLRPIVRRRLKAANPIAERLCFSRSGDDLTIGLDDRRYTAPLSGGEVTVTGITGDELKLHHQLRRGELRQIFVNDEAARINAYRPAGEELLKMSIRVYSDRLPEDLEYELTYRRKN